MKKKIALIEDDQLLVKMYKDALERDDYEVVVAHDGEEGLKLIKSEKPDLILLDIKMPKMDGFEMMREMKDNSEVNSIPIVVLTNYSADENIAEALELGAREFDVKSDHTPNEVVDKVAKLLDK